MDSIADGCSNAGLGFRLLNEIRSDRIEWLCGVVNLDGRRHLVKLCLHVVIQSCLFRWHRTAHYTGCLRQDGGRHSKGASIVRPSVVCAWSLREDGVAAPVALGAVHRLVGMVHQGFSVLPVGRVESNPDACANLESVAFHNEHLF